MMEIGRKIGKELQVTVPMSLPMAAIGTVVAYIFSQNVLMSFGAGACAAIGFVTYFSASAVVNNRKLEALSALVASVSTAYLFHVSAEIFVLTTSFSLLAMGYIVSKINKGIAFLP